jgi:hypothetical protein
MKKIILVLLPALLWQLTAAGQQPRLEISRNIFNAKQVVPPSPEAAELGKYGNVPVSLFTGAPNVTVPLVELKGNFLSLPVSLSYNHMGFKPEEIAPWTGLGWAMNAGGVISRSVIGHPDVTANYYKTPSPLDPVPTDEYQKQLYYEQIRLYAHETQPDLYYYNFMGKSGKFVISPSGTIINKEKSYLKIEQPGGIEGDIIITDEQGIVYEFRALESTYLVPWQDNNPGAPSIIPRTYISAWYLTKVIAPNGLERLDFEYWSPSNAQSTISQSLTNTAVTYTKAEISCYGTPCNWTLDAVSSEIYNAVNPGISITKKFIKKVTLVKNNITIGYIDFESDADTRVDLGDADFTGERLLKKVKLYNTTNSTNTLIKEFVMSYAYFGFAQVESPGFYRRLMLKTVREMSTDSVVTPNKPPYIFKYNGETSTMPGRYPPGLDHWGYYNAQSNNYSGSPTLVPTVNVPSIEWVSGNRGLGANREPSATDAELTVLQRIDYPTGGYTTFTYEGHLGTGNVAVGGLRILEITDNSFPNKPAVVKRYEYKKEDGTSSGEVANMPNYITTFTWENLTQCSPTPGNPTVLVRTWNATISASSTFGLGTIAGSHIGYRRVTEYQSDLTTNRSLGKTVYTYNIAGGNEVDEFLGNGDLVKQQTYDNGDKLLEEITNTYTYEEFDNLKLLSRKIVSSQTQDDATKLYVKVVGSTNLYRYYPPIKCVATESGYNPLYDVPSQVIYWHNEHMPRRRKLTQQLRKVFDIVSNTYTTYTKNYTYGNSEHIYPTLIEEVDSKTDKVFTSIKYAADYTISCSPSPQAGSAAAAIKDMQDKNMKGISVEKLQYRENGGGGNRRYISGEYIQHKSGLPEKIYYLQASPMPTNVTASTASCLAASQSIDANYRLSATLSYDTYMNLREESKADDITTTYFWGYDNRYPVAKVLGKTLAECNASGISQAVLDNPASESALKTELLKLRALSGALVSTNTYKPMVGMISARDIRGQLITYEYDQLNRLVNIKDSNEIVKNFRYNYGLGAAPTTSGTSIYYNAPTQGTYTRTGCSLPLYGEDVVYFIPYGKHAALTQTEANNLAATDLTANGQAYANLFGQCVYKSAVYSQTVYTSLCTYEQGPPVGVLYTIPFGKYTSPISQADANAKAVADFNATWLTYANTFDYCSCTGEGKKYINGTCETGLKLDGGSTFENGQWICSYYYRWSDWSTSQYYYIYQSEPCPIDP